MNEDKTYEAIYKRLLFFTDVHSVSNENKQLMQAIAIEFDHLYDLLEEKEGKRKKLELVHNINVPIITNSEPVIEEPEPEGFIKRLFKRWRKE